MNRPWRPQLTDGSRDRPGTGDLIAKDHAVWRVLEVRDVDRTPEEETDWVEAGKPKWTKTPYVVEVAWVGGVEPRRIAKNGVFCVRIPAGAWVSWDVYRGERWPMCSCCREPMPCRAEMEDRQVTAALDRVETLTRRLPGCCWACGDPISRRQQSIVYVGDNLDLPGGPDVRFHLRASCLGAAAAYERKWLSVDHTRRRMLTWPECEGAQVFHADGSTECVGDARDPDCLEGTRDSHRHSYQTVCSVGDVCARGCPVGQHYIRPRPGAGKRRLEIRDPDLPQGTLPEPPAALDRRQPCPGHLLLHRDGRSDCIAGGRDDCWGGDTFRHEVKRHCHTQTHGCATCDVGGAL